MAASGWHCDSELIQWLRSDQASIDITLKVSLKAGAVMESDVRPTGVQLKVK